MDNSPEPEPISLEIEREEIFINIKDTDIYYEDNNNYNSFEINVTYSDNL